MSPSSRMVRLAQEALQALAERLAGQQWEVGAILDLFARSARERGGVFSWAGIYGALRWCVSRRSADRLLHWLEDLGHVEVIDRGDRHTPRRIRVHIIPINADPYELRKARREVCRRWNPALACAHRTSNAAPVLPTPSFSHAPIALSTDPDPCWPGTVTPDPWLRLGRGREPLPVFERPVIAEDAPFSADRPPRSCGVAASAATPPPTHRRRASAASVSPEVRP